jgi:hypothetical protein
MTYFRELGLETSSIVDNELEELFELSLRMFDTRLPPGVTVLSPFAEDSSLNKVGVEVCDCIIVSVQNPNMKDQWHMLLFLHLLLQDSLGSQMICAF